MFDQFYHNVVFPKSLTSLFVDLIPKVESLLDLGDFIPISLVGYLYKMLAKVLTARLVRVMVMRISLEQ